MLFQPSEPIKNQLPLASFGFPVAQMVTVSPAYAHFCIVGTTGSCSSISFQQFAPLFSGYLSESCRKIHASVHLHHCVEVVHEAAGKCSEETKLKWTDVGPDISKAHRLAIQSLSRKLSNRCKALMRRIICFSPQDENLQFLLASWIKAMKPRRADWLAILKEMKRIDTPLLTEVTEYALLQDSFEANIRDYTKLVHIYGKLNLLEKVENTLGTMKSQGIPCDQVMLTTLIHIHSKSGDLMRAEEVFKEMQSLGQPLDKRSYGSMVMGYVRAGKLSNAEVLLKELQDEEIYPGREVYKALLRAYSTLGDAEGAQRVFDAIQFAGTVPDERLCALLVNAYCAARRLDDARDVIENMRLAGMTPCDRSIALMVSSYEKAGCLDKALAFLAEMEEAGIEIGKEASTIMAAWFGKLGAVHEVDRVLRDCSQKTA